MTDLNKPVRRVTNARRHEKSKHRAVILSLEPPAEIGVRLQGTKQTYRLGAEQIYELAVRWHEQRIDKRARQIKRDQQITLGRARNKARKELAADLRINQKGADDNE